MTNEKEALSRARMSAQPFAPVGLKSEFRDSHSLEYIAFYLGEIEGHLGKIAGQLENNSSNGAKIALELQGIVRAVSQSKM